ncbi:hypothetical protein BD309DRAFT_664101 [Dichomitus squalens]|uniref:Uncharacterized protein n=1 Tax=Dichomitus squalens TaxID=114155 RepID=A0A4Q9PNN8_9APHY|nr:hypothetical protein BD309DRAFT_664101 [Dichomitus squalens]TBU55897.1 hypothetical protein BD310DRAFT_652016 [Dichomitus squalens]
MVTRGSPMLHFRVVWCSFTLLSLCSHSPLPSFSLLPSLSTSSFNMAYPLLVISVGLSTSPPKRLQLVALVSATTTVKVCSAQTYADTAQPRAQGVGVVRPLQPQVRASRRSPSSFGSIPKTSPGLLSIFNDGAQLSQGPSILAYCRR